MKKLLIYIPTFNRLNKLRECINRLIENIRLIEESVEIHISDNNSTDGTWEYIKTINKTYINYSRNENNIGGPRNVLKAFTFADIAEFTWIIGDDDFVINDGIRRLVNLIIKDQKIDFYFLNTLSFPKKQKDRVLRATNITRSTRLLHGGKLHSKIRRDFYCTLQDLISPVIDPVFGGALMCYAYRSNLIKDTVSQKIYVTDLSQPESCYPHTLCWLYSLTPTTPCLHLHEPFTLNVWHEGVDWGTNGLDLALTHGLGHIFYEALRLGYVRQERKRKYFQHYVRIAGNSYTKLMNQSAGNLPFNPEFKNELLSLAMDDVLARYGRVGRVKRAIKQTLSRGKARIKQVFNQ